MVSGMARRTGTFLGIPYDWRRPTWARMKERYWNPEDPRLLAPHMFGWGWSINVYELLHRVGLLGR